jgi:RND family efflux transporter MFP subunit
VNSKNRNFRAGRAGAATAVLFVLVLTSCSREEVIKAETTTPASSEAVIVPVAKVRRVDIASETTLTAEFQPFQEVDVMAKVAGYVKSIKVDLGDRVREGQLLAVLEIPEMQDDLSRAEATIERASAELSAARDELARSESAHQIAHLSYTRIEDVAKREAGLIPQQEIDEARARDLVSEAQVAAAKSKIRVAEQQAHVSRADQARVRTMNNYISITAPFAGTVTKRYANTGSMIQAGTASQSQAMPLVRLSQNSTLRLSLPVPESMVSAVRVGAPVDVLVTGLQRTIEGRVARFAGKVDKSTRTMTTEVDVANPNGTLMPGMYAQVTLPLQHHADALSVPVEAIERAGASVRIYRVEKSGEVKVIQVQLGLENAQRAEVLSGLEEGDEVIVGRRAGLKEGEKVRTKLNVATDESGTKSNRT